MRRSVLVLAIAALAWARPAAADLFKIERFSASADFRVRAETDWDSQDAAGVAREDRTRLRVRARVGLRFDATPHWRFEARVRSGAEGSQQSPHLTILDFDRNDTGDLAFTFDRYIVRGQRGGLYGWAGRNVLPFWKQNELLFDDDVTMTGAAGGWEHKAGPGNLALSAGYFTPPVGMRKSSGTMFGAQAAYQPQLAGIGWAFALGTYSFDAHPGDLDAAALQQGNGGRDYRIVHAAAQARRTVGGAPLALGVDVLHNARDYNAFDPDPVTAANAHERDGYAVQASYGSLSKAGQWLAGYTWAHIETLAVNNSYAQDDWVRWGSDTQTRASNMKGHEVRFGWAFDGSRNILARLYLVEAITSREDGRRFRFDYNWTF